MRYKWLMEWGLPIFVMALFAVLYFLPYYQGYRFKAADQIQQDYVYYTLQEAEKKYHQKIFWAPHLFSGMPAYLVYYTPEGRYFWTIGDILAPIFQKYPPLIFFVGLLGFFLFLRVEGVGGAWALAGAIGFVLTSYYTNMIVATHWGKSNVLFSAPYALAGMGLIHRGRWSWGILLTLLGWAGLAGGNHPQMLYYTLAVFLAYELHWLWKAWQEKNWRAYLLQVVALAVSAGIGSLSQISSLLPFYEYGKYSIRGGSELERDIEKEASLRTGLDRSYAQSYSASRAEIWTLIIPDFVGGTSEEDFMRRLGKSSAVYQALIQQGIGENAILRSMPAYWGGSPFSAGSFYAGVVWFFLMILGWLYRLEALDWFLLYVGWTVLLLSLGAYGYSLWVSAVLLALPWLAYLGAKRFSDLRYRAGVATVLFLGGWGLLSAIDNDPENAYKLTDFALDYLPFYNKFRAPSTWLVVMGFLFPWVGLRGLQRFIAQPDPKRLLYATFLTGAILLIVGWAGSWIGFSFEGPNDEMLRKQLPEWFMSALQEDRIAIARQSTLRSLLWVVLASGLLWFAGRRSPIPAWSGAALAALALIDGWLLNSQYFPRKETYIREREVVVPPPKEPYEEVIAADTTRFFRILPMHTSAFTDARPSVYFENAGGYHPAKLKRYQQLIEAHLSRLEPTVLQMLCVRYITARPGTPPPPGYDSLTQTADGVVLFRSQKVLPIAWLSPSFKVFPRVDQALDSLGRYPAHEVALLAEKDFNMLPLKPTEGTLDSTEGVVCLSRTPNRLEYTVSARQPRLLVFSEVHYPPDWKAYVDGQPTPIVPANFVLRSIVVPAGTHTVTLVCKSLVHEQGKRLSQIGSLLAWLLIAAAGGWSLWKSRQRPSA